MNALPAADFASAHRAAAQLLSLELGQVRQGVQDAAAGLPGPGGAAVRLMVDRPGKLVRPLLVGLVHRALGGPGQDACSRAAALVEVIHLSTLLHDDVIDEAELRRGAPSAAAAVGNAAAVLGGDALVVRAISMAHALGPHALERTLHALHQLLRGELMQLAARGDADRPAAWAREVAGLKTGALMTLCVELGVLTAGRSVDEAVRLGRAFDGLGPAFQIVDDLLDLTGDAEEVGKAVGKDVAQGTISFPLAVALERSALSRAALRRAFARKAGEARLGALVRRALAQTGAVAQALEVVRAELAGVAAAVQALPPSPERDALAAVCAGMAARAC